LAKKALITGITGQDGSYLAELLLKKGYEVHGIIRRASTFNTERIDHLYQDPHEANTRLFLHYGDLAVSGRFNDLIYNIGPDEIYHLAAQSHVKVSFIMPEYTGDVTGLGTTRILEAIRKTGIRTRFYQASSSEMFGAARPPQSETTPFQPQSPYAAAKVYAYWLVRNYREGYGIFAANGILFNHESPRRGETFVTRKITRAAARIRYGLERCLYLGNLDAKRDWGYAPDFVKAMWLILQQDEADDFVAATGESHSVREFCELAFAEAGIELEWRGGGKEETGVVRSVDTGKDKGDGEPPKPGDVVVAVDPQYFRPTEVDFLLGNPSKVKKALGWEPSVTFTELVRIMVRADIQALVEFRECRDIMRRLVNGKNA